MAILIENMEMPTEGYIDVRIKCNGTASFAIAKNPYFKAVEAVSVPEPHGRLIDAEQLKETLDYYICEAGWSDEINKALSWVKDEFIDSEPTVIPASEEAE